MPYNTQNPQQGQQQQGGQGGMPPSGAIPPGQVQMPQQGQTRALPPTGLQQQAAALAQNNQGLQSPTGQQGAMPQSNKTVRPGQTNLNDMAENLARNYGIQLGANQLMDENGNFNRLPTSGQEAVGFQFISQAIADEQNRRQMKKSEAALQQGMGQVQQRGRGSLASMQSGQFENLANLYQQQQYKAADFSYFALKEQQDLQEAAERKAKKQAKKAKTGALVGGIIGGVVGTFVAPGIGTAGGYALGSAVGGAAGGYF